jgi:hypothetical protein
MQVIISQFTHLLQCVSEYGTGLKLSLPKGMGMALSLLFRNKLDGNQDYEHHEKQETE